MRHSYTFNDKYTFDVQKNFLKALIFDQKWAKMDGLDIIKPKFFENRYLYDICTWVRDHYREYKMAPDLNILREKANKVTTTKGLDIKEFWNYENILTDIFTLSESDNLQWYKDQIINFIRQVAWKKILDKGGEILENGNYEEALNKFKEVLAISTDNDLGLDFGSLTSDEIISKLSEAFDTSNMFKTGIKSWDEALGGGFLKDNLHIIGAAPGYGKAVSIETPVLTPTGWKKAKDIKIGDYLISRKGIPTKVLGVYPQGIKNNYKITFNDSFSTNCCDEHLWTVIDTKQYKSKQQTLTLKEILEKGLFKNQSKSRAASNRKPSVRWKIPLTDPVQFSEKSFLIHPYNLGVLLGDGSISSKTSGISFTNSIKDIEIKEKFENLLSDDFVLKTVKNTETCPKYYIHKSKNNTSITNGYMKELERLNLLGTTSKTKFIPEEYKFSSVEQRLELLKGLMDTDGSIQNSCKISFSTISEQLAKDVIELVQSLGGLAHSLVIKRKPRKVYNYKEEIYFKVIIKLNLNPFSLTRKSIKWHTTKINRYITSVEKQEDVESVCFSVDNEEKLFLLENYIVTHNTRTMAFLTKQAILDRKRIVFISLELTEQDIMGLILTSATGLTVHDILDKEIRDEFLEKKQNFFETFCPDLAIKFYKPESISVDTINNYILKLINEKQKKLGTDWKPDVIFLDYLDKLLPTQKIKGNSYQDIGGIATDCKNLAITFGCPVISASQLGKYTWDLKGNEVISMQNIAESAQKVHIAHSMTTINVNTGEKSEGKCRLYMAKSRTGTFGKVIWCNQNLKLCALQETEEWDPKALDDASTVAIKALNTGKK